MQKAFYYSLSHISHYATTCSLLLCTSPSIMYQASDYASDLPLCTRPPIMHQTSHYAPHLPLCIKPPIMHQTFHFIPGLPLCSKSPFLHLTSSASHNALCVPLCTRPSFMYQVKPPCPITVEMFMVPYWQHFVLFYKQTHVHFFIGIKTRGFLGPQKPSWNIMVFLSDCWFVLFWHPYSF